MKRIKIINSYVMYVILSILCLICIFFANAEASRIAVNDFSDEAVLIDFSELPNVHDYPSPITLYENISDVGVTYHVISAIPTFRTSGFDEGIATNTDSETRVDAIVAVFSEPVLRAGAVIHISKAMVYAYDENNNLLEQHHASNVSYDTSGHGNHIKEFVGVQNQAGIKKLVFEDVEFNGRIIAIQDFIFEAIPNTFCVSNETDLIDALNEAKDNGFDDVIKIQQGTYIGNFVYASAESFGVTIEGGYTGGCASRVVDPDNTVLDGGQNGIVLVLSSPFEPATLFVEGITLQNGDSTYVVPYVGGLHAITNQGEVTLNNNNISNNSGRGLYADMTLGEVICYV